MDKPQMVKEKLEQELSGVNVEIVEYPGMKGGDHIGLRLVGDLFDGLSKLERHQKVMDTLKEELMTGHVHAVKLKIYTPSEFQSKEVRAN